MILVPLALIISAFIPWAITPLLMIGGAFLCFEGVEKVLHMLEARKHKEDPAQSQQRLEKLAAQDPLKFERTKLKGDSYRFYFVCGNRRHYAGDCGRGTVA